MIIERIVLGVPGRYSLRKRAFEIMNQAEIPVLLSGNEDIFFDSLANVTEDWDEARFALGFTVDSPSLLIPKVVSSELDLAIVTPESLERAQHEVIRVATLRLPAGRRQPPTTVELISSGVIRNLAPRREVVQGAEGFRDQIASRIARASIDL